MTKEVKERREKYLNDLIKERNALVGIGAGLSVLEVNEEIARIARSLKLDYYSL